MLGVGEGRESGRGEVVRRRFDAAVLEQHLAMTVAMRGYRHWVRHEALPVEKWRDGAQRAQHAGRLAPRATRGAPPVMPASFT